MSAAKPVMQSCSTEALRIKKILNDGSQPAIDTAALILINYTVPEPIDIYINILLIAQPQNM